MARSPGTDSPEAHAHNADPVMTEMLDLDVEVLHEYHRDLITWIGSLPPPDPLLIDLGAGTGTGALALAQERSDAQVIAVDGSDGMLDHLRHRARALGVAERIRTVQADLDQPWPALGPADLVWASASLHHLADPGGVAGEIRAALRPGGIVVVVELDSFPRFLTADAAAGVEERGHALMAEYRAEAGMRMGEDWGARLAAAGFDVDAPRRFDIQLRSPLPAAAGRYAQVCLQRMRQRLDTRLSADDLAILDTVIAGLPNRDNLSVRTARTVWLGRQPVEG